MTEQFPEFVARAKAGKLMMEGGAKAGGVLVERVMVVPPGDIEGITAEAYNQGVLPLDLPWEQGLVQVKALLS